MIKMTIIMDEEKIKAKKIKNLGEKSSPLPWLSY